MNELFILDFWYGDGYGGIPIVLGSRSDAEEMALAIHQEHLYGSFLYFLLEDGRTVEKSVEWAYDDVYDYDIKKADVLL
jgi:hypothetical protein